VVVYRERVTDPQRPTPASRSVAATGALAAAPWVLSTYFAEGLPYSLVHQVATQEYFTAMGVSLEAIGLASLYHLAWNFKFVWSPLVERIGTTRQWILGVEALLALLTFAMATVAHGDVGAVAWLLVPMSFLAATHDIAIDGYYLRCLDDKAQAGFSGVRVAAYRIAMLVGKGGLVLLAGVSSWFFGFAAGAGLLVLLLVFHAVVLPRDEQPRADPAKSAADPSALAATLLSFFRQERIGWSLGFILLFRAGDAMMFAMSTPLLKSLGLDTATRGFYSGTLGTLASIGGSIVGGALIARYSLRRTLVPIATAQATAILLYAFIAWSAPTLPVVAAVVLVEQLVAGIGTSAFAVFLMQRSAGENKVVRFAVASALMSVAATAAGSLSGFLADAVGFTTFFLVAFLAALPGVALSLAVPKVASPPRSPGLGLSS
jgi:PAT family beta-lactamase induction signal transducer AmpG